MSRMITAPGAVKTISGDSPAAYGDSAARGKLVEAHHPVDRDVVTDAHHEALAPVVHDEVDVGHAAGKRLRRDRPAPAGKALGPRFRIDDHRMLI